ncbi:MAG: RNA polymerase sigma factor [Thermoanaerobaculia bacterium]
MRAARRDPEAAPRLLDLLFSRYQPRVTAWCVRFSGRRDEAADLAQEVFLRVHERLDQFRFDSAFVTWIYLVTRSVTINRSIFNRRRDADSIDEESFLEPADPAPALDESLDRARLEAALRQAIAVELDPLEAQILHLHFFDELPLASIDRLLGLENKSGSKAFIVSAKRKLKRYFAAGRAPQPETGGVRT